GRRPASSGFLLALISTGGATMKTEMQKMLDGELYHPLDAELVTARTRARDLCWELNGLGDAQQEARRRIVQDLFAAGGDTVILQPPFYCDYGSNIELGEKVFLNFN